MDIAIYGGSFNPIHLGHVNLALSLVEQGYADCVWLMVSPQNPLKNKQSTNENEIQPTYFDRLNMARAACKGLEGVEVSDFENHLPIPSYTYTTLNELSKKYPHHRFLLIIGADNWVAFEKWYKYDEIINNYKILVYRRPGYDLEVPEKYVDKVTIIDNTLYDVSSTEIRNHQKTDMLHKDVFDYIKQKHLYGY